MRQTGFLDEDTFKESQLPMVSLVTQGSNIQLTCYSLESNLARVHPLQRRP